MIIFTSGLVILFFILCSVYNIVSILYLIITSQKFRNEIKKCNFIVLLAILLSAICPIFNIVIAWNILETYKNYI